MNYDEKADCVKSIDESINVNQLKDLFNENQVTKIENLYNEAGDHQSVVFHLSNGKITKIGGISDEDVIYIEIS